MTLYEELTELAERADQNDGAFLFRDLAKLCDALPDILAALEERDRLREATSFLCDRVAELDQSTGDFEDMVTDYYGHVVPALHNARAALEQPK